MDDASCVTGSFFPFVIRCAANLVTSQFVCKHFLDYPCAFLVPSEKAIDPDPGTKWSSTSAAVGHHTQPNSETEQNRFGFSRQISSVCCAEDCIILTLYYSYRYQLW
jgi:hypothetical protein